MTLFLRAAVLGVWSSIDAYASRLLERVTTTIQQGFMFSAESSGRLLERAYGMLGWSCYIHAMHTEGCVNMQSLSICIRQYMTHTSCLFHMDVRRSADYADGDDEIHLPGSYFMRLLP